MRKVSAEYPVLRSARLRLRPFALEDCAAVNRLVGDESVASTLVAVNHPYSEDMARRWIAKHQPSYDGGGALFTYNLTKQRLETIPRKIDQTLVFPIYGLTIPVFPGAQFVIRRRQCLRS